MTAPLGMRELEENSPTALGLRKIFGSEDVHVYAGNRFRLITSKDGGFLHASISHQKRYPTWNEIRAVRDWFFPSDMEVVMVLPRAGEYVNVSENCFHLWQSRCGEEGR